MAARHTGLKILIADGDPLFINALSKRLKALASGVSVEERAAAPEFLDTVYRQPYDLIFLDAKLPSTDGLELLARVGQTTLPLPIVMTSSLDSSRLAVESMKRGVLEFILKTDLLTMDLEKALPRLLEAFRHRQESAELKHINQMKDDFLATISHELRTPLTSILGLCEVLLTGRMGALQDEQVHSLRKVLNQSHNLVRLINQLLEIRNFTHGESQMELSPLAFHAAVDRQVESQSAAFEKKGVRLLRQFSDQALWVRANEENLTKVVEHLVSNGLKFTPKGGTVTVETRRLDSGHVQFKVTDTGLGIPPEALPHVFQKFFHADQSLTRPYGGMGLGLAYCKEVVEAHGGRIWIESKGQGKGTLVSFLLPGAPAGEWEKESPLAGTSPRTVLWVDDNPALLELVEYSFTGFSRPVKLLTAQGGQAAMVVLEKETPDLIVLDIMMPDMDGLELLGQLKSHPRARQAPVLVVSGYKEAARTAMQRGATDFCLKPFKIQEVLDKVENLLSAKPTSSA